MRSLETKSSRLGPKSFETETKSRDSITGCMKRYFILYCHVSQEFKFANSLKCNKKVYQNISNARK